MIKAPEDVAIAHRHPKVIATDAYLNDPITFKTDARFDPVSALKDSEQFTMIERDQADFAIIDLGATGQQNYAVETYIDTFTRTAFARVFDA